MTATFQLDGHRAVLVVRPHLDIEATLAAVFIRHDANVFYVRVERSEDGQIQSLTFRAEMAE